MPSVDNREVRMTFNNSGFNGGISESITMIDKLKSALNFKDAEKGFASIEKAALGLDIPFISISDGVGTIAKRFSTLGVIGTTVLKDLTTDAYNLGKRLISAIPRQIISGGTLRSSNIEQAKFQLKGLGVAWEDLSNQIDYGVKDTAYGLDEAAKVASQLVASNVQFIKGAKPVEGELDDMSRALRAVSGVAAMTNSSYSEIGDIFTTIASNGKLMTQQLRQFSFRGLNASAVLAKSLNKTEAQISEMVSKGKIDFQTFANAMDDAFGEHAKDANETFTGALSNMKAALSRIGADFATPIREGERQIFNALRGVFNQVRNYTKPFAEGDFTNIFNDIIDSLVTKINALRLDNFGYLMGAVSNSFRRMTEFASALYPVFKRIGPAWRSAFPTSLAETLNFATRGLTNFDFSNLSDKSFMAFKGIFNILAEVKNTLVDIFSLFRPAFSYIMPVIETILDYLGTFVKKTGSNFRNVKDILKGVFSLFDLGAQVVSALFKAIKPLFSYLIPFANWLLKIGASAGRFITAMAESARETDLFNGIISGTIDVIKRGYQAIVDIFNKIKSILSPTVSAIGTAMKNLFTGVKEATGIQINFKGLRDFFDWIFSLIDFPKIADVLVKALTIVGSVVTTVIENVTEGIKSGKGINLNSIFSTLFSLSIADLAITLTSALSTFTGIATAINGALTSLIAGLNADVFYKIAKSLGLVAASLWLISTVDSDKLWDSVTAVGALAGILAGAFALIDRLSGATAKWDPKNNIFANITSIFSSKALNRLGVGLVSTMLLKIAFSVLILAAAVKMLASTENMGKGLVGVTIILGELLIAAKLMSEIGKMQLSNPTKGLMTIVFAIAIIAGVAKSLSKTENLQQGLFGVSLLLGELVLVSEKLNTVGKLGQKSINQSKGVIGIAIAILLLMPVLKTLSAMSWEELAKGVAGLSAVLFALYVFFGLMSDLSAHSQKGAFGLGQVASSLIAAALAMLIITPAIKTFASMSWEELAKGGAALVVILGSIFGFFALMNKTGGSMNASALSGALLLISVSMLLFSSAMKKIGKMSWGDWAKGIAALAAVFIIIGVAGLVLGPVIINIMLLSDAMLKMGLATLAFGAGLLLASIAITTFSGSAVVFGAAIIEVLRILLVGIVNLTGELYEATAALIRTIVAVLVDSIPIVATGALAILDGLGQAFEQYLPTFLDLLGKIITEILVWLGEIIPVIVPILVNDILIIIFTSIKELIRLGEKIRVAIVSFLKALGAIIAEELMILFGPALQTIDKIFGTTLYDKVSTLLSDFESDSIDAVNDEIAKLQAQNEGIKDAFKGDIPREGTVLDGAVEYFKESNDEISASGDELETQLRKRNDNLKTLATERGTIVKGSGRSLTDNAKSVKDDVSGVMKTLFGEPSDYFTYGENVPIGLGDGIEDGKEIPIKATQLMGDETVDTLLNSLGENSPSVIADEAGVNLDQGLADGVKRGSFNVKRSVVDMVNGAISRLDGIKERTYQYGKFFDEGFAEGITYYVYIPKRAVIAMAQMAVDTLANTIDSASPSKETMMYGRFFDEGFGLGISKNTDSITNSIDTVGDDAISGIRDIISRINSAIDGDFKFDPTIRPVLDLSEIQNGARNLGSIMNGQYGFTASMNYARSLASSMGGNDRGINAQYNDSNIISSIQQLRTDVRELGETMANMKIMLDTGALVGGMTDQMDRSLGRIAANKGRGM